MKWNGLVKLAAATMMAGSMAVAAPSVAQAAVPVSGGTPVLMGGVAACTLTATGHDDSGAAIAFTAGHCSDHIEQPVILRDDQEAGVIGTVVARNEVLDYTVIRLTPVVDPVGQAGVAGTGPAPEFGDVVCKDGLTTGHTCGITWQREGAKFWSQACAGYGDSGGPVTRDGRLVGLLSGGHMPPASGSAGGSVSTVLPSCFHAAQSPFFLPVLSYSFDTVVADATERNWPGRGFEMA